MGKVVHMGKRREGFLTQWQWDYIRNPCREPMSKERQKIEDYYIRKSLETALKQLDDVRFWIHKQKVKSPYFDEKPVNVVKEEFQSLTGRKTGKLHKYRLEGIKCPNPKCKTQFTVNVGIMENKIVSQTLTYSIVKKGQHKQT